MNLKIFPIHNFTLPGNSDQTFEHVICKIFLTICFILSPAEIYMVRLCDNQYFLHQEHRLCYQTITVKIICKYDYLNLLLLSILFARQLRQSDNPQLNIDLLTKCQIDVWSKLISGLLFANKRLTYIGIRIPISSPRPCNNCLRFMMGIPIPISVFLENRGPGSLSPGKASQSWVCTSYSIIKIYSYSIPAGLVKSG